MGTTSTISLMTLLHAGCGGPTSYLEPDSAHDKGQGQGRTRDLFTTEGKLDMVQSYTNLPYGIVPHTHPQLLHRGPGWYLGCCKIFLFPYLSIEAVYR